MQRSKTLHKITFFLIFIFIFVLLYSNEAHTNDYKQIPGLIDLKTNFGDGAHDLEFLVKLAKKRGFNLLFINDHDRMVMEYGIFPFRFRPILHKKVEKPSINGKGAEKYLNMIRKIQSKYPEMILIPGAESAPFYYWTGNPLKKNLTAHNWERHLLIFGLEKPKDYKNLPILHNGFSFKYTIHALPTLLIFLILLVLGILLIRRKGLSKKFGIILLIITIFVIINQNPFRSSPFDQYHGNRGIVPYQLLIDYVNSKGGMTFWNHPETKSGIRNEGPINVNTPPYPEVLQESKLYTGFAAVYGENIKVTEPGKQWDKVLQEYCLGLRSNPIWGISTADYHKEGEAGEKLGNFPTVFLVKTFNKKSILSALKNGKMYAYGGDYKRRKILDTFELTDPISGNSGIQGDEILSKGPATIHIIVRTIDKSSHKIRLRLIRTGQLIKVFEGQTPFVIYFKDNYYKPGEKIYYRLDIKGAGLLVSNPIFMKFLK